MRTWGIGETRACRSERSRAATTPTPPSPSLSCLQRGGVRRGGARVQAAPAVDPREGESEDGAEGRRV